MSDDAFSDLADLQKRMVRRDVVEPFG